MTQTRIPGILTLVFASALSLGAEASSVCDPLRIQDTPLTREQQQRVANCERIVESGLVPNQQAFAYTIRYLAENTGRLQDSSCALQSSTDDDNCSLCQNANRVQQGIQNRCSFVLNDLQRPFRAGSTQMTGYFVDLCATDPRKVVQSFYVNTGTGRPMFNDTPGKKSSLAGAFLTDTAVVPFSPFNATPYQGLRRQLGGTLPSLRLLGLNSSNNSTDFSKPMHVSPFRTSWGCPSIGPEAVPFMRRLAEDGPSLVMNYGNQQFEQRGRSCVNNGEQIADSSASQPNIPGLTAPRAGSN